MIARLQPVAAEELPAIVIVPDAVGQAIVRPVFSTREDIRLDSLRLHIQRATDGQHTHSFNINCDGLGLRRLRVVMTVAVGGGNGNDTHDSDKFVCPGNGRLWVSGWSRSEGSGHRDGKRGRPPSVNLYKQAIGLKLPLIISSARVGITAHQPLVVGADNRRNPGKRNTACTAQRATLIKPNCKGAAHRKLNNIAITGPPPFACRRPPQTIRHSEFRTHRSAKILGTIPQRQDYPALARRRHAPARADLNAGPGG